MFFSWCFRCRDMERTTSALAQSICTFKASVMLFCLLRSTLLTLPWSPTPIGRPGSFPNPLRDITMCACRFVWAGFNTDVVIIAISKDETSLLAHFVVWRKIFTRKISNDLSLRLCLYSCWALVLLCLGGLSEDGKVTFQAEWEGYFIRKIRREKLKQQWSESCSNNARWHLF